MQIYKPHIIQVETQDQLYFQAYDYINNIVNQEVTQLGSARIALAGGNTPLPLYTKMAESATFPWESTELFQLDERAVHPDSSESNQYNIRKAIGEDILDKVKAINFIQTSLEIDKAIQQYEVILESLEQPLFDVAIVGVGRDGHIASLFPNGDYLKHQEASVIATTAPQNYAVSQRISLSIEAILSSKYIVILLSGSEKIDVIREIVEGELPATSFPVKFLLAHPKVRIYEWIEETNPEG